MKTTKTISTISFNTKDYLIMKLKELNKSKIISFWCFIEHLPEDDEGGKKQHIHLFIEPAKSIQTEDLREQLKELDLTNKKPLGVLPFQFSKISDWLLYAIHDKYYLADKMQSRKYHYSFDDIITSDSDYLNYHIKQLDVLSLTPYRKMQSAIEQNYSFNDFFSLGSIPIQQIYQYKIAWDMLTQNATFRNNRQNHEIDYIETTKNDIQGKKTTKHDEIDDDKQNNDIKDNLPLIDDIQGKKTTKASSKSKKNLIPVKDNSNPFD